MSYIALMSSGSNKSLSKSDVIFYYGKKNVNRNHIFMLNLIILGTFYIHKCKWSETMLNTSHFKANSKT